MTDKKPHKPPTTIIPSRKVRPAFKLKLKPLESKSAALTKSSTDIYTKIRSSAKQDAVDTNHQQRQKYITQTKKIGFVNDLSHSERNETTELE